MGRRETQCRRQHLTTGRPSRTSNQCRGRPERRARLAVRLLARRCDSLERSPRLVDPVETEDILVDYSRPDNRLLDWATALHLDRNDAAHSSGQTFSADDAEDLLAFATAICEYVFVFAERFQEFQKRRAKSGKGGKS